ncbi:hypothetical protein [Burkholderia pyrrocinia]|uniref:hypothetical protein n=1 Tax=Burkholderia pyrrocinia TaxID=60550 RepID=UPI001BCFA7ED|nr:hypothetical protein [Burkholderia pyrrocinia]QVN20801.1 hypothetical protein JYG32_30095 [Burkholderia pyrrocinia]
MNVMSAVGIVASSPECKEGSRLQRRFPRMMVSAAKIFLFAMCVATAGESFAGSENYAADYDCRALVFDNDDDDVLSSYNHSFGKPDEIYWNRNSLCVAFLSAGSLTPFLGATDEWGNWLNSRIALTVHRNDDPALPGVDRCRGSVNYDACVENAVFSIYGFRRDERQRWRLRTYQPENGFGISLEQSMSNTVDGTIERPDGITVFGAWRHPYIFPGRPKKWWVTLYVIRHTPFGYVMLSSGTNSPPPLLIPQEPTPESYAQTIPLINRLVQIVQSVRVE